MGDAFEFGVKRRIEVADETDSFERAFGAGKLVNLSVQCLPHGFRELGVAIAGASTTIRHGRSRLYEDHYRLPGAPNDQTVRESRYARPMPRRSERDAAPRQWLVAGEWPEGEFHEDAPDTVAYAVEIAKALEKALGGETKASVAASAQIQRTVLYRILEGASWPDSLSVAKLELALGAKLWPADPPKLRRRSDSDE